MRPVRGGLDFRIQRGGLPVWRMLGFRFESDGFVAVFGSIDRWRTHVSRPHAARSCRMIRIRVRLNTIAVSRT